MRGIAILVVSLKNATQPFLLPFDPICTINLDVQLLACMKIIKNEKTLLTIICCNGNQQQHDCTGFKTRTNCKKIYADQYG